MSMDSINKRTTFASTKICLAMVCKNTGNSLSTLGFYQRIAIKKGYSQPLREKTPYSAFATA
ncbi:MAG: hypothetical protein NVS4B1_05150 [Ktedonobacteraceae bacterium]